MKYDLKFASRFFVLLLGLPLSFNTMAAMSASVGGGAVLMQDLNNAQRLNNTQRLNNASGTQNVVTVAVAVAVPAKSMPLTTAADFANGSMRGFNMVNYGQDVSDRYKDSDFSALSATKANLVRTSIILTRCGGCNSYTFPEATLTRVEHMLQAGEKYGFKVVVVLAIPHAPGEAAEKAYWTDDYLQRSIAQTWQGIASRLKSYPALAAYDVINEPVPPQNQSKIMQQQVWHNLAVYLGTAIRNTDPSHVLIFESAPWASAGNFNNFQTLPFANIVYSFHFYYPYWYNMQGTSDDAPYGVVYPNAKLNKQVLSLALQPVRDFVKKIGGAPVYVGEFGAVRWSPGVTAYLKDVIDLFEAEKWSWTYYTYHGDLVFDAEVPNNASRSIKGPDLIKLRNPKTPSMNMINSYFSHNTMH